MAEINQVDILVKADVPAIVDNQQLLVYVPVATNSNYGIVKPDGDDLTVENGILKLKEGGSVQQGQLDKKVDKLTDSSSVIADDILKLYAQDNEGQEGYVSGSKGSLENSVAIRTVEGTLKSQRARTDWDLVPLKQAKEIAQANDIPEAITDTTLDANIGQNAITHKSLEKWTYNETGKSEYVNVDRRIPIIAGKGIKFVKNDDLKAISIYTDLEAKLNENIFKNPEKTYIVWKGANFPNSNTAQTIFDVGTVIDFGDGEAPTVITEALANTKVTHTYFDDTDYHIITITYPNTNARAIRANKYNGCTGLIYILTSRYITSIEEGAFSNCSKLDYLYLPNVNTIGNYAFQGMGTILDIDMPAVTSIGEYCFQGNKYSKHIVFPKLHTISVGALQIFEDVELGPDLEAVTIIKQFALNNCKVLTISDEKQSVLAEQNAFSNKLKRIYVPKSKYSTYISDWVAYYDKIAYKIDSYDLFLELGKCIPDTEKGEANGVATLDASGKVPSSQLPSYVDDVINGYIVGSTPFAADWLSLTAGGTPLTPEKGKIYVIVSEGAYLNNSYRWSGTVYAPIGSSIAVLQQTGQSTTDVMSQKATTDSLNLLEAKLNENAIKDSSKTYLIVNGNVQSTVDLGPNVVYDVDWGDGIVQTSQTTKLSHIYTDGVTYHLITITSTSVYCKNLFAGITSLIKIIVGTSTPLFLNNNYVAFEGDTNLEEIDLSHCGNSLISDTTLDLSTTKVNKLILSKNLDNTPAQSPAWLIANLIEELIIPTTLATTYVLNGKGFLKNLKKLYLPRTESILTLSGSYASIPDNCKVIVPKSLISAYKSAAGWSMIADKIVYEVDSSDLPDTSKFAKLDEENTFTQKQHLPMTGMAVGTIGGNNPAAEYDYCSITGYDPNTKTSERFYLPLDMWKRMDNVLALRKDIPDTSNLSTFSVEVW